MPRRSTSPSIGGNVSFYNESRGRDIDPTPVVGVVGSDRHARRRAAVHRAARARQHVVVLGTTAAGARRLGVGCGRARARRRAAACRGPRRRARACTASSATSWPSASSPACTTAPTAGSRSRSPRWRSAAAAGSRCTAEPRPPAGRVVLRRVGVARRGRSRSASAAACAAARRRRGCARGRPRPGRGRPLVVEGVLDVPARRRRSARGGTPSRTRCGAAVRAG